MTAALQGCFWRSQVLPTEPFLLLLEKVSRIIETARAGGVAIDDDSTEREIWIMGDDADDCLLWIPRESLPFTLAHPNGRVFDSLLGMERGKLVVVLAILAEAKRAFADATVFDYHLDDEALEDDANIAALVMEAR